MFPDASHKVIPSAYALLSGVLTSIVLGNSDLDLDLLGIARTNAPTAQDVVTHPLLHDPTQAAAQPATSQSRSRRTQRNDALANVQNEIMSSLHDTLGAAAVQVFQRLLMNRQASISVGRGPLEIVDTLAQAARNNRSSRSDSRTTQRGFEPLLTSHRWSEEARMLYGRSALERLIRLENHASLAMLPSAIQAAEEAKRREEAVEAEVERQRLADEQTRREREEKTRQAEEEKNRDAPSAPEGAAADATQAEVPATEGDAPPLAASSSESVPVEPPSIQASSDTGSSADESASSATATGPVPENVVEDPDQEMEDATSADDAEESEEQAAGANVAPAGPSTEQARVTVMIHGNPVDITDTGIDPDFLEALPDEMREEVLNQHMRDQRASRVERAADSQISPEFLDALPPEIRAEIIQQENIERAARAPPAAPPAGGVPAVAAEIDSASFMASLDPQLRQVIMMEQEEGFIQTLPSHMVAEANLYREARQPRVTQRERIAQPPPARKAPPPRDAIQLVDKAGVATLTRLLFFPQALRKSLLLKVLLNLCENAKTRTELLILLTSILQDGTTDVAAIDRSFAQLSFRNVKSPGPPTPKTPSKQRVVSDSLGPLALPSHEAVPELIAQRCLEALSYVVNTNELCAVFFLTQHELTSSMKRSLSKKGKGKEKQTLTHFPIVSLLGLLDRRTFLKTPSIMEGVVGLLAVVTRPLTSIAAPAENKDANVEPSASPNADDAGSSSAPAAAETEPVAVVAATTTAEG
jgi:E3 ubiquitin-protein ligase HUWE1